METKEQPIVLVLSRIEAQVLIDLTANVGGSQNTYRRYTQSIQNQLKDLGFAWRNDTFTKNGSLLANEIQERQ